LESVDLHLIGHLQRNKAKLAAQTFSWVQSIDKRETAAVLDRWAGIEGRRIDILLEVNTSGEESKFGVRNENELWHLVEESAGFENLQLRGLMTLGPLTQNTERIRASFANLRRLYEKAQEKFPELPLDTLSMGMSGDYEIAVAEGATMVRIGTAIFGRRDQ
jgi:pyridoxal phosphate enzyme (YggS family)